MNASMLVPFFLVASAKKDRRSRLAEAMIPTMVPLPPAQMVAVAAISADAQVRREDRRVAAAEKVALETAVPLLVTCIQGGTQLSDTDYNTLIKLEAVNTSPQLISLLDAIRV